MCRSEYNWFAPLSTRVVENVNVGDELMEPKVIPNAMDLQARPQMLIIAT